MNLQRGNFSLSWSQTVYQRKTRNQILWSPRFGTSIWSPDNLGLVRTTGLDTRLTLSQKLFKHQTAEIKLGYDLADARNLIAISVPAIGEGTQLWFVPRHQAWCRLQYMGNNWSVFSAAHLHARVSTPEGGLAPVYLLSAGFSKMFKIEKLPLTVSGRLENLANQTWFSIDRRPLPGRNWQLGFSYHIQ
jgi:outer membrane receptor protein involved in Fe transport